MVDLCSRQKGGMLKEAHVITAIGGDDTKTTEFVPYQDVRRKQKKVKKKTNATRW